jgi:hypothetical protein
MATTIMRAEREVQRANEHVRRCAEPKDKATLFTVEQELRAGPARGSFLGDRDRRATRTPIPGEIAEGVGTPQRPLQRSMNKCFINEGARASLPMRAERTPYCPNAEQHSSLLSGSDTQFVGGAPLQ